MIEWLPRLPSKSCYTNLKFFETLKDTPNPSKGFRFVVFLVLEILGVLLDLPPPLVLGVGTKTLGARRVKENEEHTKRIFSCRFAKKNKEYTRQKFSYHFAKKHKEYTKQIFSQCFAKKNKEYRQQIFSNCLAEKKKEFSKQSFSHRYPVTPATFFPVIWRVESGSFQAIPRPPCSRS